MANNGVVKITMNLTTNEQKETWEDVRGHYGPEFSNSAILYDLTRIKRYEVKGFKSNRDRLNDLDKEVAELKTMVREILNRGQS